MNKQPYDELKVFSIHDIEQAEKLKSREKKEGWMKNDEGWTMMISSCWGVL